MALQKFPGLFQTRFLRDLIKNAKVVCDMYALFFSVISWKIADYNFLVIYSNDLPPSAFIFDRYLVCSIKLYHTYRQGIYKKHGIECVHPDSLEMK